MARIPFAEIDDPDVQELVERIRAGRGSVLLLYQMLLHSPPVAAGWLAFLTAVRQQCALDGQIRELVIMRIAGLNNSAYEADQHQPYALKEGVSAAQLQALPNWRSSDLFERRDKAVLAYTDAMTLDVQVPDAVFSAVRAWFDERTLVELTATIAAYNMVSRFLEALHIHPVAMAGQSEQGSHL